MSVKGRIGVLVDNLHLPITEGIKQVKELGADGFQVYVIEGEMTPENMTGSTLSDFKAFVADLGLEISALCGDLGKGFLDPQINREVIPRSKEFIDLAVKLGVKVVTTHIGTLPEDENAPQWQVGVEAVRELATYAHGKGCVFASETGPEAPTLLLKFLRQVNTPGIGINYDPANLIMLGPFDHIGGVHVLKDYIVHTHAKDGVCLMEKENQVNDFIELPLGEGAVVFKYYLRALDRIGYDGYLTIERELMKKEGAAIEVAEGDRVGDVRRAIQFLRSFE
jgi:L-ribulose-5-phosphate 3-epimerase